MDDGLILRADVFRPEDGEKHPVILTYGLYAKWAHFEDTYPFQWKNLTELHPEGREGSTCKYQQWEVANPEKWIPDGYIRIRVDSCGAGRSPGYLNTWSPRETKDFYDCIEWRRPSPGATARWASTGFHTMR